MIAKRHMVCFPVLEHKQQNHCHCCAVLVMVELGVTGVELGVTAVNSFRADSSPHAAEAMMIAQ